MPETALTKTESVPLANITGPVGGWDTLAKVLAAKLPEMERVVNAALSPEKLTQLALTAMKSGKNADKIVKCTGLSVAKSFMDLAMIGLNPAPQLGLVCFVPYGNELQLQVEYRGFITLAKRSGEVSYITADTAREGDDLSFERGTNQYLRHVPRGEGEATHYYAVVRLKDGSTDFRVMTKAQVERHRDKFSKQYMATKSGPWKDHPDAMSMKTCIRQLCKFLCLSPELTAATIIDEYNEAGVGRTLDMSKPGRFDFSGAKRVNAESEQAAEEGATDIGALPPDSELGGFEE